MFVACETYMLGACVRVCVCVCVLKNPPIDPIDDKYIPTYVDAYICMCFVYLYVCVCKRKYSICAYMHM